MDRFWSKAKKAESGCWLWTGSTGSNGYGNFKPPHAPGAARVVAAHRMAWRLAHGEIPPGMHVLHRCDVRLCVNPSHLFLGTNADNVADCWAKGRGAPQDGQNNPKAKIEAWLVPYIRATTARGIDLAAALGVDPSTISNVRIGRTWKEVA